MLDFGLILTIGFFCFPTNIFLTRNCALFAKTGKMTLMDFFYHVKINVLAFAHISGKKNTIQNYVNRWLFNKIFQQDILIS